MLNSHVYYLLLQKLPVHAGAAGAEFMPASGSFTQCL